MPRQKQKTHHLEADVQSSGDADSSSGDFKAGKDFIRTNYGINWAQ